MKKLLALLLALVMVFSFAACGNKDDAGNNEGEKKAETSYDGLDIAMELTSEEYGIGFRKDSDITEKVNGIIDELTADGTMAKLAEKYNLTLAE